MSPITHCGEYESTRTQGGAGFAVHELPPLLDLTPGAPLSTETPNADPDSDGYPPAAAGRRSSPASPLSPSRSPRWSALASPASAATSATATYTKKSDWGSGFEGQWTVKNTGTTALSSWTIEWDYPSGTRSTPPGTPPSPTPGPAGPPEPRLERQHRPRCQRQLRLQRLGPGAPSGCKLNGAACDGSTVPGDNPPSAPGTPTTSDVTNTSVKLSWSAATDDNGVKNYDVLRNGSKIATVTGPRTPTPA